MHMPNEILSVEVAFGGFAVAGCGLGVLCRFASKELSSEKVSLMGIFGAFIFAAQMINVALPFPPGASGHLTGAVLLAIILGPAAAAVVMASVVIIQCLVFQDGGLLALGCNIINLAIVPSFMGHTVYHIIAGVSKTRFRIYSASMIASVVATVFSAVLVSIETALSGVIAVPFITFLAVLAGVHVVIGLLEGVITAGVLGFIRRTRGSLIDGMSDNRLSKRAFAATIFATAIIICVCFLPFASEKPDGLEWTLEENAAVAGDGIVSQGWGSLAAVGGSLFVMVAIWVVSKMLSNRKGGVCTTR